MNLNQRTKTILLLSGLFDMFLGGYLTLSGIGWLPSPFGELPMLKWIGTIVFLTGTGAFAFFFTRPADE